MSRRTYKAEQIIGMLREAEIRLNQGETVGEVYRGFGVSERTYNRWRREYGGMEDSQAYKMKELERENARLRRAVSDLTLDKMILNEALTGKYRALDAAAAVSIMLSELCPSPSGGPVGPWARIDPHNAKSRLGDPMRKH